jgi:hypothetical protein
MPAKKTPPASKRAVTKVAEAAAKYTARSGVRTRKPSARKRKSPGQEMWAAFLKLPEAEREAFVQKMLGNRQSREDIMDIAVSISRRGEVGRPYSEIREELKRDGLL